MRVALAALLTHRGRSILTSLGIVIGTAAVIAMVSAGDSARRKLDERLDNVGKSLILIATIALPVLAVSQQPDSYVGWLDNDGGNWQADKARLQAFGEQFDTAWDLYMFLSEQAGDGEAPSWADMAEPEYDWSGIYTRTGGGLSFDPDSRGNQLTAQLTPAGAAARQRKIDQLAAAHAVGVRDAHLPRELPELLDRPLRVIGARRGAARDGLVLHSRAPKCPCLLPSGRRASYGDDAGGDAGHRHAHKYCRRRSVVARIGLSHLLSV